jgi:PPM family protein phosphatase
MTDKKNDSLMVTPGNAQHIGLRGEQQDSFGFSHFDDPEFVTHGGVLAVVADGMGGLALGKESSAIAVQTFLAVYAAKESAEAIADVLDRGLHAANRAVNKRAAEAGVAGEAGTTIVAVVIHDGKLYRISAGDSRIYLFRQGTLTQITTDYNYGRVLDRMVANGEIGLDEAAAHPSRAALTSYLGKSEVDDYDQPSDQPMDLMSGDKVLLASDGLFGFLPENDIVRLLMSEPQQAAEALIQETIALQSPYQDNVTVAVLGYDLPPVKSLSSTVMRSEGPRDIRAMTSTKKMTRKGYWLKIATVILVLAVVGFFGGRYFGSQGLAPASPQSVEKTSAESTLAIIMTRV